MPPLRAAMPHRVWAAMTPVVDTNVLARFIIGDDEAQEAAAIRVFEKPLVIIPTIVFCELAWVMRYSYQRPSSDIASAIRGILKMKNVVVRAGEVQAGLQMLDAGGDFADAAIAHTGSGMAKGGAVFTSFDKKAVRKLSALGFAAITPVQTPSSDGAGGSAETGEE